MENLRQRNALHVRAEVARTNEFDLRVLDRDIVAHGALRDHDDAPRAAFADVPDHPRGGPDKIGLCQDIRRTFRMRENLDAWILPAEDAQFIGRETLMHFTAPSPENDLHVRLGRDVTAEILVGKENHPSGSERL